MSLLVVIPAYNEATRIAAGLSRIQSVLGGQDALVVVSDNGSTDDTRQRVEACGVSYVRLVDHPDKGLAIHCAWRHLAEKSDVLAYCDADMAADPEALLRGLALIRSGQADAVVGSRWHRESKVIGRGTGRSLISSILSFFWRRLPGSTLSDPGCGLKLIRTASFTKLNMPERGGFAFGGEVMVRLQRARGRVVEIPVTWTDDRARRLRLGKAAWDYAKAWWRLFLRLA